MSPKFLSEVSGRTHVIRLKITPPIKPNNKKVKIPREGTEGLVAATIEASICHAVRSFPLGDFEKTTKPGMDDRFLPGDSIGIRKVISFALRDSALGCPTTVLPCGRG